MHRITKGVACALVASALSAQPAPALAQKHHRDRYVEHRDDDRYDNRGYDDRDAAERSREYEDRTAASRRYRYDVARYYRGGGQYRPYRLGPNDRIYRGSDDRYYCKHDDGTTGLIVGGMAGGVLGQIIAPGGYKTLGAILGAGAGALVGRAIDDGVECR